MKPCNTHGIPLCRECSKGPDDRVSIPGSTLKVRPKEVKPRKPLKKTRRARPMKPEAMSELLADVLLRDGRCVAIDHTETNCKGRTEAHHLVPQRVLREHYPIGDPIFSAFDNCVALCQRHHGMVEAHSLYLPDEVLPDGFTEFCEAHGFDTWIEAESQRRIA